MEYVNSELQYNSEIKRDFYRRAFKLQEYTLALSIIYKINLHWKESQAKMKDRLAFIVYIQKHKVGERHNVKFLEPAEIQEMEIYLRFWEKLAADSQRRIEEEWEECIKIWDFIDTVTLK